MIILVTGGRGFTDSTLLYRTLDELTPVLTLIIEGGQRTYIKGVCVGGADYWAMKWAELRGVPYRTVEARWHDLETPPVKVKSNGSGRRYNALAGFNRNTKMVGLSPDIVVATEGGGGTQDCVDKAKAAGIMVIEVKPDGESL